MEIKLNGTTVKVITQRSTRAKKTLDMEFTAPDVLKVTIPTATDVDLEAILKRNHRMLERKHKDFLTRKPVLFNGKLLVDGKPHELTINRSGKNKGVELSETTIIINTGGNRPGPVLKQWMTEQTRKRVEQIQLEHDLNKPDNLRIVDTARWGYVKDQAIHINNQLVTLPPRLQEFIVVHEHLHLAHMNHGRTFQSKLSELIPDYPIREHELTQYIALDFSTL